MFFEHKNQYHIEINDDVRLYDLLLIKLHLIDFFKQEIKERYLSIQPLSYFIYK